jgi:hypothetical protein
MCGHAWPHGEDIGAGSNLADRDPARGEQLRGSHVHGAGEVLMDLRTRLVQTRSRSAIRIATGSREPARGRRQIRKVGYGQASVMTSVLLWFSFEVRDNGACRIVCGF